MMYFAMGIHGYLVRSKIRKECYTTLPWAIPRTFDPNETNYDEHIIWDENEQVAEMYLI